MILLLKVLALVLGLLVVALFWIWDHDEDLGRVSEGWRSREHDGRGQQ